MLSEILKIDPQLDANAAQKMEQNLSSRFKRITGNFARGFKNALLGGGGVGVALALIDKVLNPLKETQESIDKILARSNDLGTFAHQFGSTPENLFKLETLGQARGVTTEEMRHLLLKFQEKIVQYRSDTSQPSTVSQFADEKDQVNGFFKFIQSLQKLSPAQQQFVQADVFGAKQVLKTSEFLQTKDFGRLAGQLHLPGGDKFSKNLNTVGAASEAEQANNASLQANAFANNLQKISDNASGILGARADATQLELNQETKRIASYDHLKKLSEDMEIIKNKLEDAFTAAAKYLPELASVGVGIVKSRTIRAPAPKGKGE